MKGKGKNIKLWCERIREKGMVGIVKGEIYVVKGKEIKLCCEREREKVNV